MLQVQSGMRYDILKECDIDGELETVQESPETLSTNKLRVRF